MIDVMVATQHTFIDELMCMESLLLSWRRRALSSSESPSLPSAPATLARLATYWFFGWRGAGEGESAGRE